VNELSTFISRKHAKDSYGPLSKKNVRSLLKKELLQNFGFENMNLIADLLIERFLQILGRVDAIFKSLQPFQTVIFGLDRGRKYLFGTSTDTIHLKPAKVNLLTTEEMDLLSNNVPHKRLRPKIAVRILREAYSQGVILTFADVGVLMCESPARISQLVSEYRKEHPEEFVPHCGSVLDMGGTTSHKKDAILLFYQGKSTSEIARAIHHEPKDVDSYLNDYQRIIELYDEGKNPEEIAFLTRISVHVVKEHVKLYREIQTLKGLEKQHI